MADRTSNLAVGVSQSSMNHNNLPPPAPTGSSQAQGLRYQQRSARYLRYHPQPPNYPTPPASDTSSNSRSPTSAHLANSWACCRCDAALYSLHDDATCLCGHARCLICDLYFPNGAMDINAINGTFHSYNTDTMLEQDTGVLLAEADREAGLDHYPCIATYLYALKSRNEGVYPWWSDPDTIMVKINRSPAPERARSRSNESLADIKRASLPMPTQPRSSMSSDEYRKQARYRCIDNVHTSSERQYFAAESHSHIT